MQIKLDRNIIYRRTLMNFPCQCKILACELQCQMSIGPYYDVLPGEIIGLVMNRIKALGPHKRRISMLIKL